MQLNVGRHCQLKGCGALDFLPFLCDFCSELFCLEHRVPEAHGCAGQSTGVRPAEVQQKQKREEERRKKGLGQLRGEEPDNTSYQVFCEECQSIVFIAAPHRSAPPSASDGLCDQMQDLEDYVGKELKRHQSSSADCILNRVRLKQCAMPGGCCSEDSASHSLLQRSTDAATHTFDGASIPSGRKKRTPFLCLCSSCKQYFCLRHRYRDVHSCPSQKSEEENGNGACKSRQRIQPRKPSSLRVSACSTDVETQEDLLNRLVEKVPDGALRDRRNYERWRTVERLRVKMKAVGIGQEVLPADRLYVQVLVLLSRKAGTQRHAPEEAVDSRQHGCADTDAQRSRIMDEQSSFCAPSTTDAAAVAAEGTPSHNVLLTSTSVGHEDALENKKALPPPPPPCVGSSESSVVPLTAFTRYVWLDRTKSVGQTFDALCDFLRQPNPRNLSYLQSASAGAEAQQTWIWKREVQMAVDGKMAQHSTVWNPLAVSAARLDSCLKEGDVLLLKL